jgi:hypothetical protein
MRRIGVVVDLDEFVVGAVRPAQAELRDEKSSVGGSLGAGETRETDHPGSQHTQQEAHVAPGDRVDRTQRTSWLKTQSDETQKDA